MGTPATKSFEEIAKEQEAAAEQPKPENTTEQAAPAEQKKEA